MSNDEIRCECRMTNDEIRKNVEARMTKRPPDISGVFHHSDFELLSAFGIRHSAFGIRHS